MSVQSREEAVKLGRMLTLPRLNCSLLVRTDFTGGSAWQQVSDEAQRENEDVSEPTSSPSAIPGSTVLPGRR